MTDGQLAAILAFIAAAGTGVATLVKWVATRIVAAMDAATKAVIDNTASNAVMKEAIGSMIASNRELAQKIEDAKGRIDEVADFVEENTNPHAVPVTVGHPARKPATPPRGSQTPPRGTYRHHTRKEGDE